LLPPVASVVNAPHGVQAARPVWPIDGDTPAAHYEHYELAGWRITITIVKT
jgi:hypothetical protein